MILNLPAAHKAGLTCATLGAPSCCCLTCISLKGTALGLIYVITLCCSYNWIGDINIEFVLASG